MAAGEENNQGHRAGVYKQKNKGHKHGKHRTKGEIEKDQKGRVSVTVLTKKQRREQRRMDRRHKANQLRRNKKDLVLTEKRRLGSKDGPPHLVVVVALHAGVDAAGVAKLLCSEGAGGLVRQEQCVSGVTDSYGLVLPRFKQRFILLRPDTADLYSLLDVAKIADSLVFVLDPTEGWDSYGDYCLSSLFAQGLPSHVLVSPGVADLGPKKRVESKRTLSKNLQFRFPDSRVFPLDSEQEATLVLRHLGAQRQRKLGFRSRRPHLVAQHVSFTPNGSAQGGGTGTTPATGLGTLCVSGYVRGCPLKVDRLVHLSGYGDFQLSQIDAPLDPLPLDGPTSRPAKPGKAGDEDMQDTPADAASVRVLMKADPLRRESLQAEAEVDPMDGEQTWPTETELHEAEEARKTKRLMKTWMEKMRTLNPRTQRYDDHIDEVEEGEGLKRYREARAHVLFPDEVDTPLDATAKNRFQRYRGLKSFRSSPWDPMENLPPDYSRIFQFQSFDRTRRRILAEAARDEEGAMVGWYVTLHVIDVPAAVMEGIQAGRPLVVVSLMPHEQKMSVMHLLVRRHPNNTEPIKSKEELVFQCGFRRFRASPTFSQHSTADKHKMERFLRDDAPTVVTVYAPITFPPAGTLVFKQREDGAQDLVATGSLLSCNPQRVNLKRLVLSGHPFKINRHSATVRYMFFSREENLLFGRQEHFGLPVELRTKWGRRGHIKEPLGTHGHMKCVFDNQLPSQDTVLMNLYKRAYPRWTYDPYVPLPLPWVKRETPEELEGSDME
ncbi:hypothetical protein NHX12_008889 [Muraenolepis orangiensis]|uniref:Pre-rRNA-processing protein TSR1 homolog n=1 Tax=Muraenolepis orangiensis TaxID=630683 RepID=A0A9Q0DNQ0_9TELE|nr:hypothetical protein NHX12_008889 [Muraenolepis orangiensis]